MTCFIDFTLAERGDSQSASKPDQNNSPSRSDSSGMARSSNVTPENQDAGTTRNGLGVLQPLGWLARGAMNLGGNILGRRNSGNNGGNNGGRQ